MNATAVAISALADQAPGARAIAQRAPEDYQAYIFKREVLIAAIGQLEDELRRLDGTPTAPLVLEPKKKKDTSWWTPERRAEHSAKMKRLREERSQK